MSQRSERNLRERTGIDAKGVPSYMRPYRRSNASIMRQIFEARRFLSSPAAWTSNVFEMSFSRTSVATSRDPANRVITHVANEPRWERRFGRDRTMLMCEKAATNFLLNSTAPATQTTGSLAANTYTLWVDGPGSATITAGTGAATGLGTATQGAPLAITVTSAGTFNVTVTGTLTRFQLEGTTYAAGVVSSFIATAGTTQTRQADRLLWVPTASPGGSGLFGATGTLLFLFMVPHALPGTTGANMLAELSDGTSSNRYAVAIPSSANTLRFISASDGITTNQNQVSAILPNTFYRVAFAWNATGGVFTYTGLGAVTAFTRVPVGAFTTLALGNANGGGSVWSGGAAILQRHRERLPDAMLLDMVRNP